MKNLIFLSLCLVIIACKKSDPAPTILGKWNLKKVSAKLYIKTQLVQDTLISTVGTDKFYQFNKDGTGTTNLTVNANIPYMSISYGPGDFTYKLFDNVLSLNFAGGSVSRNIVFDSDGQLQIIRETNYEDVGGGLYTTDYFGLYGIHSKNVSIQYFIR